MAVNAEPSLEQHLAEHESRIRIAELVANYCRGCDGRDEDLFMSIWHPDATYAVGGPFDAYEGHEGIRRGIHEIWASLPETHHWTTNLVVELSDGDHAHGESDVVCHCIDNDGVFMLVAASYHDDFDRRDGIWRIAHRSLTLHYRRAVETRDYDA